jgi:hypothetical protein
LSRRLGCASSLSQGLCLFLEKALWLDHGRRTVFLMFDRKAGLLKSFFGQVVQRICELDPLTTAMINEN